MTTLLFDALNDLIARAGPDVVREELPRLFTLPNLVREPMAPDRCFHGMVQAGGL